MSRTVVTDFDLVCTREWLNSALTAIPFVGYTVGCALGGFLSDRIGRKRVFVWFSLLGIVQTLVLMQIQSLWVYMIWRSLQLMFALGCYVSLQTYAVEIVPGRYKILGTSIIYV